jgi:GT2 family glycosyltransferase
MVVWNGLAYLDTGVRSILSNIGKEDDFLIVDNNSTDGSPEYIKTQFPNVCLLQTGENLGGAGGFNAGVSIALQCPECEYIWLLDNDIIAQPNALPPLVQALANDPTLAGAGSQICLYNDPEHIQEVGSSYGNWSGSLSRNHANKKRLPITSDVIPCDYLAACSLLTRASILRDFGLFKNFFIFYDDVEWGLRMNANKFGLIAVPASIITHNFSGQKPIIAWREYYRKRNRAICLFLFPPKHTGIFALFLHLVSLNFNVINYSISIKTSLKLANQSAKKDFLSGKTGKIEYNFNQAYETHHVITSVYTIDISHPGDYLGALALLQSSAPRSKYVDLLKIRFLNTERNITSIACGRITLKGLFIAKAHYLYCNNQLILIKNPYALLIRQFVSPFIALPLATIQGAIDFVKVISRRKNLLSLFEK